MRVNENLSTQDKIILSAMDNPRGVSTLSCLGVGYVS